MTSIDSLDARIMVALDDDPEATTLALARTLGVSRNTVHARLARLDRQGLLLPWSRRVDPAALGYPLTAFVRLAIEQRASSTAIEGIGAIPEVVELHATTGDFDVLVRVVARDTADLFRVTSDIAAVTGVQRTSTSVSLAEPLALRTRPLLEAVAGRDGRTPDA
ncbi:Lrp/AsnC family transcriptional regulator [Actinotalea sp. M2MS4P-6]|uniref:Lrp/AsnC family transcriptional regulator n=1 Tax=Actinotalea sp. M2MS4P-6 TaxID=2983762 RepID=UPI0021E43DE3|nr:Lrp/AsnC family transcriptional regulator [Actinotalea sp. M2MS4P-6]MCV2393449.1 Lrp/AsnC family transcriptional regulator [Actinotalea sp. M2MS4P-6]